MRNLHPEMIAVVQDKALWSTQEEQLLSTIKSITIGRCTKGNVVDINLSLEGPAWNITCRQGTLRLRNTGEFYLSSEGKRPIFVDGHPILAGNKVRLYNNSVVEIASLRFIFSVNQEIIRVIHNEAVKMNLPP